MAKNERISATTATYSERDEALLLAEVRLAVYDLFVKMRRLLGQPVTFDEIEDAYCARAPKRRSGYPDHLVEAVESWIHENTNAENEFDQLFFVDENSPVLDRWHINEHAVPADYRERRRRSRPVPRDPEQPKNQPRVIKAGGW